MAGSYLPITLSRPGFDGTVIIRHGTEILAVVTEEQLKLIGQASMGDELETLRMQLAACSTAAMGNTPEAVAQRIQSGHPYYSAPYGDVCRAVDEQITLREDLVSAIRRAQD